MHPRNILVVRCKKGKTCSFATGESLPKKMLRKLALNGAYEEAACDMAMTQLEVPN
jgi:hypothetical protein